MTPIFDESEGLIYRIELWTEDDQHVDALLAKCARIAVAYGALEAAIAEYPGRNVTLRQRTRLLDGTSVRARRRNRPCPGSESGGLPRSCLP